VLADDLEDLAGLGFRRGGVTGQETRGMLEGDLEGSDRLCRSARHRASPLCDGQMNR
jgi:hypothetical protein